MKLYEFEAKKILEKEGVEIPAGTLLFAKFPSDAEILELLNPAALPRLYYPPQNGGTVMKGQILSGARKKSGAIKFARNFSKAKSLAEKLFAEEIISAQSGEKLKIKAVLVEEKIPHQKEIYLSLSIDKNSERILIIAAEGGTEIEELAKNNPEKIFSAHIDAMLGLKKYAAKNLAKNIGLEKTLEEKWFALLENLFRIFIKYDASLLEINPLAIGGNSEFIALDAKMIIDDSAIFRQPFVSKLTDFRKLWTAEETLEKKAEKIGVSYVKLDGDIGCMVNGAGLAMATMDLLKFHHGRPANFLDVGGGASKEKISRAFEILLKNKDVSVIFINILGGILRCDVLAESVSETLEKTKNGIPVIARLAGTNAEEAKKIFLQSGKFGKNLWLYDD